MWGFLTECVCLQLALVGKGLCYDTGGLNLKGSGNIETMYTDKHGACTVFGTMAAIAALAPKCNVLGCMALAENAIGEEAQHPYDIVKSYKGLTVHIDNTDAEGRVSLPAVSPLLVVISRSFSYRLLVIAACPG